MSRRLTYALASCDDEAELRALLRNQPLPGWVTLSFEREPDFFAANAIEGERHRVLLARDGESLAGFCSRVSRRVFINGEVQWLGYMGQFRTALGWQGSTRAYRLLREGFAEVRQRLRDADEMDWDITSILADNHAARRILTASLPGLPDYQWLTGFNTLVYRSDGRSLGQSAIESGEVAGLAAIADCLQRNYRRYQFAPLWDESTLTKAGLAADDFLVLREGGKVIACAAIWDQRDMKQTVVRAYRWPLGRLRPLLNIVTPLLGLPRLPSPGEILRQGWLSHLACDEDDPRALQLLLSAALQQARQRGLEQLMLGLADEHPLLVAAGGARRHLRYRSDIYRIDWAASAGGIDTPVTGVPHLELAVL